MAIASHTPGALPLWFTESRFTADNNLFHVAELTPYTQAIAAVKGRQSTTSGRRGWRSSRPCWPGSAPSSPVVWADAPRPVPHGGRHRLPLIRLLQRERVGLGVPGLTEPNK